MEKEAPRKELPHTLGVIEKLRRNAQLNKLIHFNASKRNRRYHIWFGVPIVVITVFISFLFALTGVERSGQIVNLELPTAQASADPSVLQSPPLTANTHVRAPISIYFPVWMEWVGALLALFAAALSGVQTFFNFQKEYEGNRQIANQYLSIAKECDLLIALHFDSPLEPSQLSKQAEYLSGKYRDVTKQAESFNVADKDYARAKNFQEKKEETKLSLFQRMLKESSRGEKTRRIQNYS